MPCASRPVSSSGCRSQGPSRSRSRPPHCETRCSICVELKPNQRPGFNRCVVLFSIILGAGCRMSWPNTTTLFRRFWAIRARLKRDLTFRHCKTLDKTLHRPRCRASQVVTLWCGFASCFLSSIFPMGGRGGPESRVRGPEPRVWALTFYRPLLPALPLEIRFRRKQSRQTIWTPSTYRHRALLHCRRGAGKGLQLNLVPGPLTL